MNETYVAWLREKRGLTQAQLAAQLGMHVETVKKWEAHTAQPAFKSLTLLAQVLHVDAAELAREMGWRAEGAWRGQHSRNGSWLEARRREMNLSQQALGEMVGVTTSTVHTWELGVMPKPELRPKLAAALGLDEAVMTAAMQAEHEAALAASRAKRPEPEPEPEPETEPEEDEPGEPETPAKAVRRKMREHRRFLGLTRKAMARKCRCGPVLLGMVERGEITVPGIAKRIGKAYGLTKAETALLMPDKDVIKAARETQERLEEIFRRPKWTPEEDGTCTGS